MAKIASNARRMIGKKLFNKILSNPNKRPIKLDKIQLSEFRIFGFIGTKW